jgi:iron complex transport system permease protein
VTPPGTRRRSAAISLAVLLVAVVIAAASLFLGDYHLGLSGVLDVFGGAGSGTDRFIVLGQRLPRAVAGLLVGAALGVAGAVFQSISRNPLGSPDVIGFTTGSASGALVALLVAGLGGIQVVIGAVAGGLLTAVVVLALSSGAKLHGERLIVVGIAIGAMLASINDFLLTRADRDRAEAAKLWLFGSLNGITWPPVLVLAVALPVLLILLAFLTPPLRVLEMGDEIAQGLGVRVAGMRVSAALLGVALTGAAVSVSGPVGFLALAAPQLGRRITHSLAPPFLAAGCTGALLLTTADLVSQRALAPFQIPVGLVAGVLGGAYLTWLIGRRPA